MNLYGLFDCYPVVAQNNSTLSVAYRALRCLVQLSQYQLRKEPGPVIEATGADG
jgi:hypothetical protein